MACRSACTSRLWLLFPISGKGTLDSGQTRSRDAAVNDWSDEETDNLLRGRLLRSETAETRRVAATCDSVIAARGTLSGPWNLDHGMTRHYFAKRATPIN